MVEKTNPYKFVQEVNYLADQIGADRARDLLKVAVEGGDLTVEQATDAEFTVSSVGIEDTNDTEIDPATEQTLSTLATESTVSDLATESTLSLLTDALASNAGDTLQVDQQGVIDVSSRDARNLGDVDVTALPDNDYAEAVGASLSGGATNTYTLTAQGAEHLDGRVKSTGSYDVTVDWQTSGGTVITTDTVATGVAGGTWTDLTDLTAVTPFAAVNVTDTSTNAQTVDIAAHLR